MNPEVSLIVVTLEEPEETGRTVQSALDTCANIEVIVVDDHSKQKPVLPDDPRVKLIVQPERTGLGRNKNVGAKAARGDTLIFTDAHMRFPDGALASLARQAQELGGIVHPICRGYGDELGTKPSPFWGRGAYLYYDPKVGVNNCWRWRPDLCPSFRPECMGRPSCWFNNRRQAEADGHCPPVSPEQGTYEVPAMLGACYAFPRDVWNALDGAWNTFGTWGFLEQQWALRCWFLGIKIYLDPRIQVLHKFWASNLEMCVDCDFRRKNKGNPKGEACPKCGGDLLATHGFVRPFRTPDNPWTRNAIGCLYSSFGDAVWQSHIAPALQRSTPKQFAEGFAELGKDPLVLKRRDWLAKGKVVSDEEVIGRLVERKHSKDERKALQKKCGKCKARKPKAIDPIGSIVSRRGGDTDFEDILIATVKRLKPKRILEWGPGFSTDVFVHLCPDAYILSIEHQEAWFARQKARFNGLVDLKYLALGMASKYETYPLRQEPFDLVFVDGRRRRGCLLTASQVVTPGGVVVLHDAERSSYRDAVDLLFDVVERGDRNRTLILKRKDE